MNTTDKDLSALFQIINILEEPRDVRGRKYPLETLIFIALCSALCGGESFNDMETFAETRKDWLQKYVYLPSCPTHDTFNRFFQVLNGDAMGDMLRKLNALIQKAHPDKTIAFDGKTIRGSKKNGKAIHILNAWGCENRLALGQLEVDKKSNEITVLPKLMDMLDLKSAVVTEEDQCRARTRHAARCLLTLRAFSLNVLRQCTRKGSLRIKRYKAALSTDYLEELLTLV